MCQTMVVPVIGIVVNCLFVAMVVAQPMALLVRVNLIARHPAYPVSTWCRVL